MHDETSPARSPRYHAGGRSTSLCFSLLMLAVSATFPASAASDLTCESLTVLAKDRKCRQRSDHHTSPLYTAMGAAIRRRPLPGVSVAYRKANRRAAGRCVVLLARQDGRVPSSGHCAARPGYAGAEYIYAANAVHVAWPDHTRPRLPHHLGLAPPSSFLISPSLRRPCSAALFLLLPLTHSVHPSVPHLHSPSLPRHHPCVLTNKNPHVSTRTAKPS